MYNLVYIGKDLFANCISIYYYNKEGKWLNVNVCIVICFFIYSLSLTFNPTIEGFVKMNDETY